MLKSKSLQTARKKKPEQIFEVFIKSPNQYILKNCFCFWAVSVFFSSFSLSAVKKDQLFLGFKLFSQPLMWFVNVFLLSKKKEKRNAFFLSAVDRWKRFLNNFIIRITTRIILIVITYNNNSNDNNSNELA